MLPWLLILVFLGSFAGTAFAEKRVALIVGNSAYAHAGELANPRNDATDISAALKTVGFHVIEGYDLDKSAFDRKYATLPWRSRTARLVFSSTRDMVSRLGVRTT